MFGQGTEPPVGADRKTLPEYSDQCFLLDFITEVAGWKGRTITADFKNFGLLHPKTSHSTIFFSRLLSQPGIQEFLDDLPRTIASDLKPNIRLFKVIQGTKGEIDVELPLAGARIDMTSPQVNTEAVSLKSFTFDYLGTQPAEVDYYINCNMVLHFASSEAFFRENKFTKDGRDYDYSYSDLIVRYSPRRNRKNKAGDVANSHREFDPRKFRIRIDIGYNPDEGSLVAKFGGGPGAKQRAARFADFLRKSKLSLYLSLLKHTFTPIVKHTTETSFELSIDYNGAVEAAFLTPQANILIAPASEADQKKGEEFERLKQELFAQKLASAQLSSAQQDLVSKMTLEDLAKSSDWGDRLAAWTGTGIIGQFLVASDSAIGNEISDQLKSVEKNKKQSISHKQQVEKVRRYLTELQGLEKRTFGASRAVMDETRLTQAYNRPIKKLYEQKKIYVLAKNADDLLDWFKARAGIVSASTDEEEQLQKKINDANTKTEDKQKAIDRLEKIRSSKKTYDSVLGNIQKKLKPPKGGTSGGNLAKKNEETEKAMTEVVAAGDKERSEKLDEFEQLIVQKDPVRNSGTRLIYFFYFGDLLDVVMEFLTTPIYRSALDLNFWSNSNTQGDIRVVLGNITYTDRDGKLKEMSLANVPITLELWEQWWLDHVIRPRKEKYLFKAFLRDALTTLIKTAFTNRCKLPGQAINDINISIDHIPIKQNNKLKVGRIGTTVEGINRNNAWHYSIGSALPYNTDPLSKHQPQGVHSGEMIFINASTNKVGYLEGKKHVDMTNGISHISAVGGENKPVKSIEFTKTDQPFFLEAKAERAGILKEDTQMSEPYHANMTIFGHTVWKPGQRLYMYFPRTWFSLKQANRLGLGGYYIITKVSNTIERIGKRYDWVSSLECKWETWPNETEKPRNYVQIMEDFRLTAQGGGSGETEAPAEGEGEGEEDADALGTAEASGEGEG